MNKPHIHSIADLMAIDFDAEYRQEYERICKEIEVEPDGINDYNKHPERNSGNHPSDYETLTDAEKPALRYWIDHAIAGARNVNSRRNSYSLKHQFEREGFYITNGQFKGAMLLAGYTPANIYSLNWCFSIRQRLQIKGVYSEQYELARQYTVGFDLEYANLLLKAAPHLYKPTIEYTKQKGR